MCEQRARAKRKGGEDTGDARREQRALSIEGGVEGRERVVVDDRGSISSRLDEARCACVRCVGCVCVCVLCVVCVCCMLWCCVCCVLCAVCVSRVCVYPGASKLPSLREARSPPVRAVCRACVRMCRYIYSILYFLFMAIFFIRFSLFLSPLYKYRIKKRKKEKTMTSEAASLNSRIPVRV